MSVRASKMAVDSRVTDLVVGTVFVDTTSLATSSVLRKKQEKLNVVDTVLVDTTSLDTCLLLRKEQETSKNGRYNIR